MDQQTSGRAGLRALVGVLAAAVLVAACSSSGKSSSSAGSSSATSTAPATSSAITDLLGPAKQATGTAVKVGVISDGRNPAADNTIEEGVAKATFAYLDGYGGIGGRPVKVSTCETHGDPGGATTCANQMIQDGVVAVIIGQSAVVSNVYTPLHDAHMPTFLYGVFDQKILSDTGSTFALGNPFAALADLPTAVAAANNIKNVAVAVIDVPAATSFWEQEGPANFKKSGLTLDLVRIPIGAADVTPQMQRIVSSGKKTLVHIIGADSTCIAVLNGLKAVGFTGPVTLVQQCVDDATRKAVPASVLNGINMSATSPVGDPNDPGLQLYQQKIAPQVSGQADPGSAAELMFISVMAFHVAMQGVTGDVTPQTVVTTIKGMPSQLLPGGGGVHFRCNGKAVAAYPALCVRGGLVTQLNDKGQPTTYKPVGDTPVEN